MDLGIAGRRALVCASSRGLGRGCATALAAEGVHVTLNGRDPIKLAETAEGIRAAYPDVEVTVVACDITTPEGRDEALAACPDPDILINNAGGPSPGDFRDWDRDTWLVALDAYMLAPIELMRRTVDAMIARNFGRIVNITSSSVKSPLLFLGLSNGARSGLTGFVAGLSRQTVRHNVTINGLLPGSFETDRLRGMVGKNAEAAGSNFDAAITGLRAQNPAGRLGSPEEFGKACAFLCSTHAGYITGQNLLMDGGHYLLTT
jgi:3-oxoacyl-[acyl-carrier protein] reductase